MHSSASSFRILTILSLVSRLRTIFGFIAGIHTKPLRLILACLPALKRAGVFLSTRRRNFGARTSGPTDRSDPARRQELGGPERDVGHRAHDGHERDVAHRRDGGLHQGHEGARPRPRHQRRVHRRPRGVHAQRGVSLLQEDDASGPTPQKFIQRGLRVSALGRAKLPCSPRHQHMPTRQRILRPRFGSAAPSTRQTRAPGDRVAARAQVRGRLRLLRVQARRHGVHGGGAPRPGGHAHPRHVHLAWLRRGPGGTETSRCLRGARSSCAAWTRHCVRTSCRNLGEFRGYFGSPRRPRRSSRSSASSRKAPTARRTPPRPSTRTWSRSRRRTSRTRSCTTRSERKLGSSALPLRSPASGRRQESKAANPIESGRRLAEHVSPAGIRRRAPRTSRSPTSSAGPRTRRGPPTSPASGPRSARRPSRKITRAPAK